MRNRTTHPAGPTRPLGERLDEAAASARIDERHTFGHHVELIGAALTLLGVALALLVWLPRPRRAPAAET